jgi:tetratricopeptide (TPR) repeat protein
MAASAAIANGDDVAAIDMMNRAIELAPTNSSYYSFRGLAKSGVLLAGDDADEIMVDFDRAVELAPDSPMAWWMRAKFKGDDLRSLEAARLDLDRATLASSPSPVGENSRKYREWLRVERLTDRPCRSIHSPATPKLARLMMSAQVQERPQWHSNWRTRIGHPDDR